MLIHSESTPSKSFLAPSSANMIEIGSSTVIKPNANHLNSTATTIDNGDRSSSDGNGRASVQSDLHGEMVKPLLIPYATSSGAHPIPELSSTLHSGLSTAKMAFKSSREEEEPTKPSFRPPPKRQQLCQPSSTKLRPEMDGQNKTEFLSDPGKAAILPCPGAAALPHSRADASSSSNKATLFSPSGGASPSTAGFPSADAAALAGAWIRRLVDLRLSSDGLRKERPSDQVTSY